MRKSHVRLVLVLVGFAALVALGVVPSYADAPQVPGTMPQPGMSPARVWINNQKPDDAIPVTIVSADPKASPIPVRGAVSVTGGPVTVTTDRQPWEYRSVDISGDQDPARALNVFGNDGWEAVSVTAQPGAKTIALLKRPR